MVAHRNGSSQSETTHIYSQNHVNGTSIAEPPADYSAADIDRLTGAQLWEDLSHEDRLALILTEPSISVWMEDATLNVLASFRRIPQRWGLIKARYKEIKGNPWDLEKAVNAILTSEEAERKATQQEPHDRRNGHAPRQPPPLAPPLPQKVTLHPSVAEGAAPWLERYISHSAQWSPRAATHYHAAIGLWMLSGIAARRIAVELGSPLYPNLFLTLVSRSTLYAKTTTAKIGRGGLRQAGCGTLLASDRATPQALLHTMAGAVPDGFGTLDPALQLALTERMAFAAQRTWYHEEWGGMLHQMTRKDSPTAEFHGLLRWMDDGEEHFESETIARGIERITNPYLALLCSATPYDLAPFMRPGSPYWHDGFWARFAFITPLANEIPSRRRQPAGIASLPAALVTPLQDWHQRLGIPKAHIEEIVVHNKPTGRYKAVVDPLPCHMLTLGTEVLDAYYAYNDALLELIIAGAVSPDLDACYGRFHSKALRVAMLLASLAGQTRIDLKHWAYAQHVIEQWRLMLHQLVDTSEGAIALTRDEILETKIERTLGHYGAMTARQLQQHIRGYASREIGAVLDGMAKTERIMITTEGKTRTYSLPGDGPLRETQEEISTDEIPFSQV